MHDLYIFEKALRDALRKARFLLRSANKIINCYCSDCVFDCNEVCKYYFIKNNVAQLEEFKNLLENLLYFNKLKLKVK